MTTRLTMLAAHVALLVLASTCFTILTGIGNGQFQWEYFRYFSQSGWAVPYHFHYSLPVVLVYLAAYATGTAAYVLLYRGGSRIVGRLGLLLCACGLASFAFELTHWFIAHYGSWIASAPITLLPLAAVATFQQYGQRQAEPGNCERP
jgi:hypothetical protein